MLTDKTATEYEQSVAYATWVWEETGHTFSFEYQQAMLRVDAVIAQWNKECRESQF
jgi:hypothetical protein